MSGCTGAGLGARRSCGGFRTHSFAPARQPHSLNCLRGLPLISMVESTDLGNLNDPFRLVRLNCTRFWCVLIQRQMRAGFVIVAEVIFEEAVQVVIVDG